MSDRRCEQCGAGLSLARAGARFCTTACRVYWHRAQKRVGLPLEMTTRDRWMRWVLVNRGKKPTKRPVTCAGRSASSTNPATWTSYGEALASPVGLGLGFALGEGIGCIDLDGCIRPDGSLEAWAEPVVAAAAGTFMEVSQSGTGIHIFGLLEEAPGRNLRSVGTTVEVYSAGRYIAVTGKRFRGAPARLADISGVVASLT
ncbi:hypothetical protein [Agrococcus sp. DT81.2]|uniref:hypothetical protein n=1 Tax=Agrococcus sp. DT81.2 TaxID=3393414 RepID=UPI003CE4ECA1